MMTRMDSAVTIMAVEALSSYASKNQPTKETNKQRNKQRNKETNKQTKNNKQIGRPLLHDAVRSLQSRILSLTLKEKLI